ncbi:MAG: RNA-binding protein [Acidimicrobiia bacterium]
MRADDYEDYDEMDDFDEVAPEGNRLPGATARAVLHYAACAIADKPEEVFVEVLEGPNGIVLELHAAQEDVGRIIGRNGRVASALRQLARAAAYLDKTEATVEIID